MTDIIMRGRNINTNIVKAIINLASNPITQLRNYYLSRNRANNMGDALEAYIKDIFAGTVAEKDESIRNKILSDKFSYLGNQNNPPDCIIRDGDAIEVKKIESRGSALSLNSSYPKAKLSSNNSMITEACKNCEENWREKDIIYTIGVVNNNRLISLCMVYGIDYAATEITYTKIIDSIKNEINAMNCLEFSETKELGRVNKVDPLGITYFRLRGMWGIENPFKVFDYVYKRDAQKEFDFMAIINNNKYSELDYTSNLEALNGSLIEIQDVEIREPNNPAKLKPAKLITFSK